MKNTYKYDIDQYMTEATIRYIESQISLPNSAVIDKNMHASERMNYYNVRVCGLIRHHTGHTCEPPKSFEHDSKCISDSILDACIRTIWAETSMDRNLIPQRQSMFGEK